jgi:hypothetical protein
MKLSMRTFELNIFIDRPRIEVYNHMAEPINMIGLQPFLTSLDVLKEQKNGNGIVLRPYYFVETHRWLGLPIRRTRVYSVIHLTKPHSELEFHVFRTSDTQIVYHYLFQESEEGRTHLTQKFRFEKVSRLLENRVFEQANQTQRALLTNLKVRLEKS